MLTGVYESLNSEERASQLMLKVRSLRQASASLDNLLREYEVNLRGHGNVNKIWEFEDVEKNITTHHLGQSTSKFTGEFFHEELKARARRSEYFPSFLFADPAWDMLLFLAGAKFDDQPIDVTALCYASNVPNTTALRWVRTLEENEFLKKRADPTDGRRSLVEMTDGAAESIVAYHEKWINRSSLSGTRICSSKEGVNGIFSNRS